MTNANNNAFLWLPTGVIEDLTSPSDFTVRVDNMINAVNAAVPYMVAPMDLDGARVHTAAAQLRRAIELFTAARVSFEAGACPTVELAARAVFELTTRGRFLLLPGDKPRNELIRMIRDHDRKESQQAKRFDLSPPGLVPFLTVIINTPPWDTVTQTPRDLWTISDALDAHEKRDITDRYSARRCYGLLHGWLSNAATHSGLSALKRFTEQRGGQLAMITDPEPLSTREPILTMAALTGELATQVFGALGIDRTDLDATGVRLPSPGVPAP